MINLKKQIPASKAFKIIFFTVIVPILMIIGFVMFNIINSQDDISIEPPMPQWEIFNSRFTYFKGEKKGTEIKQLLYVIISSNYNWSDKDALEVTSWLNNQKSSDNEFILNLIKEVDLESTYTVTFDYNNEGWITCINIEQN